MLRVGVELLEQLRQLRVVNLAVRHRKRGHEGLCLLRILWAQVAQLRDLKGRQAKVFEVPIIGLDTEREQQNEREEERRTARGYQASAGGWHGCESMVGGAAVSRLRCPCRGGMCVALTFGLERRPRDQ